MVTLISRDNQYSKTTELEYSESSRISKPPYRAASTLETSLAIERSVQPAPNSALPKGAAGVAYPASRIGFYGSDSHSDLQYFADSHESWHLTNPDVIDGSKRGEELADDLALWRTGKVHLKRGVGFNPPINWN